MDFKNLCILGHWTKEASALEGLSSGPEVFTSWCLFSLCIVHNWNSRDYNYNTLLKTDNRQPKSFMNEIRQIVFERKVLFSLIKTTDFSLVFFYKF